MLMTVGHGTLSQDELAELLAEAGVGSLVDVRRHPGSRRHPQFGRDRMQQWLPEAGIDYRWEERLGGRRSGVEESPHVALRNDSFRAYADHMESGAFRDALDDVLAEASEHTAAVMCAETVWWKCHRRLIADTALLVDGAEVYDLDHRGELHDHAVTDGARLDRDGRRVVYDLGTDRPLDLDQTDDG